LKIKVVQ